MAIYPVASGKFPDLEKYTPDNILKFPDPLSREFRQKEQRTCGLFSLPSGFQTPKSHEFPVFSLLIREFWSREQFASDCGILQTVTAKPVTHGDASP